jgi:hypothetical protein
LRNSVRISHAPSNPSISGSLYRLAPWLRSGCEHGRGASGTPPQKAVRERCWGHGLSVIFRSTFAPGSPVPLGIDLDEAETTAVVVLAESALAKNASWVDYVRALAIRTEAAGLSARIFPVAVERAALDIGMQEQALRWDQWTGTDAELRLRLVSELSYEFCRMLRHYLEHLRHPAEESEALERYLCLKTHTFPVRTITKEQPRVTALPRSRATKAPTRPVSSTR